MGCLLYLFIHAWLTIIIYEIKRYYAIQSIKIMKIFCFFLWSPCRRLAAEISVLGIQTVYTTLAGQKNRGREKKDFLHGIRVGGKAMGSA